MFFRVKLVAIFLGVVLVLLLLVQLLFLNPIADNIEEGVHDRLVASLAVARSINNSDMLAVRALAEDLSHSHRLVQAVAQPCDEALTEAARVDCAEHRHDEVRTALTNWHAALHADIESEGRLRPGMRSERGNFTQTPSLLIVAQLNGTVVGRAIGDTADWWGEGVQNLLSYAAFEAAVQSDATAHDIIGWQDGDGSNESRVLTLVAASPIPGESIGRAGALGVVFLGFPLNDEHARDRQESLGEASLAFTLGNTISGTTLRPEDARAIQRSHFSVSGSSPTADTGGAEGSGVSGEAGSFAYFNEDPGSLGRVFLAEASGGTFLIARGGFSEYRSGNERTGFIISMPLTGALAPVDRATVNLPILGIVILLIGLVAILWVVRNFLNPLVKIDQGLQQVIGGNRDFIWEVNSGNPFTVEMAHALNVMSAFLQGKPLPDEDRPDDDSEWTALLQFADVEVTGSHPDINIKGIARGTFGKRVPTPDEEPIQTFYRRIFDEYVSARRKVDPDGVPVTYDRFISQLKKNAAAFKKKHDCKDVRFRVVVKDDRVLLKPIPIR